MIFQTQQHVTLGYYLQRCICIINVTLTVLFLQNRQALDESYRLCHNVMQMTIIEDNEPGSEPATPQ